jgi:hypothetical protein
MDNTLQARHVGNVLGRIAVGASNRDRTRVLIPAHLDPTAANEAEPTSWHRRCSDL